MTSRLVAWRLRDAARWSLFVLMSLGLHGSLLLTSGTPARARAGADDAMGARSMEARLSATPMPTLSQPGVEVNGRPLSPIAQSDARASGPVRLLDFLGIDIASDDIDEGAYLPISRVTLRPVPIVPIAVPYPAGAAAPPSTMAKIVIFIDEDGSVAKVSLAKDQPPSPFALEAKKTFEKVRYRPALLNGKPVKVRVAIVVTFEDRGDSVKRPVKSPFVAPPAISPSASLGKIDRAK